jgi:hypothetical protein
MYLADLFHPCIFNISIIWPLNNIQEREYTNLSLAQSYVPFGEVFRALFYRMLWAAGIEEPRTWASPEDLEYIMEEYQLLELRPGAAECVQKLRDAGFTFWGFTASDVKTVAGYFKNAGVELPVENLLSCDDVGVGKPDLGAYRPLLEKLRSESGGKTPWFAAAHMWGCICGEEGWVCIGFMSRELAIALADIWLDSRGLGAVCGKRSLCRNCLGRWMFWMILCRGWQIRSLLTRLHLHVLLFHRYRMLQICFNWC